VYDYSNNTGKFQSVVHLKIEVPSYKASTKNMGNSITLWRWLWALGSL